MKLFCLLEIIQPQIKFLELLDFVLKKYVCSEKFNFKKFIVMDNNKKRLFMYKKMIKKM